MYMVERACYSDIKLKLLTRPETRSDDFHGDKENEVEHLENPKKKPRGPQGAEAAHVRPGQVLSPTSSNSRLKNGRPVSPAKPQARPGSPLKGTTASRTAAATSMLSNFVEKARLTRATGTRKVTTASNTSSSSGSAPPPAKSTRRAAATPASAATRTPAKTRPATAARTGRRASLTSETSEASNTTVVRKGATSRAGTATSTAKTKATGGYAKPTASGNAKKTPAKPTTTRTGRVLRARG